MCNFLTSRRLFFVLIFLVALVGLALKGLPDGRLHVWFLDVGQGDAILVQSPDGRQFLIDGGPSPSALLDQLGEVLPFWDRSLDVVVLTHPDADHASGLLPLFERYRVTTVVDSVIPGDKAAATWEAALDRAGVTHQAAARGMRLTAGPVVFSVLNPPAANTALLGNDRSVVLRVEYGSSSLLLTGDAEAEAEQSMLEDRAALKADVLKVGHHGSRASTSSAFLAAVRPQLAIISVGAGNSFGHPATELLQRLRGVEVLRTDEHGRIELVSRGATWTIHCEK